MVIEPRKNVYKVVQMIIKREYKKNLTVEFDGIFAANQQTHQVLKIAISVQIV